MGRRCNIKDCLATNYGPYTGPCPEWEKTYGYCKMWNTALVHLLDNLYDTAADENSTQEQINQAKDICLMNDISIAKIRTVIRNASQKYVSKLKLVKK